MYSHRGSTGPVDRAFTDRYDGVSAVPFHSLNLALEGEDDPVATTQNLRIVLADFAPDLFEDPAATPSFDPYADPRVAQVRQVHGRDVVVVGQDGHQPGTTVPEADGLVTDRPGIVLVVRAADCLPIVLADPGVGVVGVAHAGRLGMASGVATATVTAMRDLGAEQVTAWIGPHVCGACYEVPAALQDEVAASIPAARATTSWGTPSLDLGAGVRAQLEADGVEVHDLGACTRESEALYSYRRDGARAGRLAGLVRIRA